MIFLIVWLSCGVLAGIIFFTNTLDNEVTLEELGLVGLLIILGIAGLIITTCIACSEHKEAVIIDKRKVKQFFKAIIK